MSYDPIQRLNEALEGRYRIERALGEGGMATVYVAEDLRHARAVALKVLKPELGAVVGAERFLAEIRVTANLQHPNILPLFDSGEADGLLFYVMPLVEGESLRERLEREKQLPVDEAVRIVTEVADALDHAHQKGVVHRDIKPANILLRGGRPLVADFGIALAVSAAGGGRLTETGLSLGTPHYMAPEQATADREVSPASDVYSLACVLYETLVGEPPHTGPSAQAVLAKILTAVPAAPKAVRASVPMSVDAAIRRALEKLPADRFRGAREFAGALADPGFRYREHMEARSAPGVEGGRWLGLTGVFAVTTVLLAVVLAWSLLSEPGPLKKREIRFAIPLRDDTAHVYLGGGDPDAEWGRPSSTSLAISPDGDLLVFAAWRPRPDANPQSQLYRRRVDQEEAEPIPGTEGASNPFFSPSGEWIGFFAGSALRRVPAAGGPPETIVPDADEPEGGFRGATWGDDGKIVYGGARGLYLVAAGSGEGALLAEVDTLESGIRVFAQPHMLPGSRTILVHRWPSFDPERAEIITLDLETGSQATVLKNAMDPHYLDTGHLLFMRRGTLWEVEFDPQRLETHGQPRVVLENVMHAVGMPSYRWETGAAQLAVSRSGHLAYAGGGVFPALSAKLVRVGFDGEAEPLDPNPGDYLPPRVSPEGDRIVYGIRSGWNQSHFVQDRRRGGSRQVLRTGGYYDEWPIWSPGGDFIALSSDRDGPRNLYRLPADGSGEPERLASSDMEQEPSSWSSEGVLAYLQGGDIWVLPPGESPRLFFPSEEEERFPAFSPDGAWIAYASVQPGEDVWSVYVRPYPGPGRPVRVSTGDSDTPIWSRDGRKIYYLEGRDERTRMMVVDVSPGDPFSRGPPTPLIDPWIYDKFGPVRGHDLLTDSSFVALLDEGKQALREEGLAVGVDLSMWRYRVGRGLHVILNFSEELGARGGG